MEPEYWCCSPVCKYRCKSLSQARECENYKKEKQDKVLGKVQQRIEYMKDTNVGEMKLWPMHPGLRRIVHLWVATSYPELTTDSIGDGSSRSIRVLYK